MSARIVRPDTAFSLRSPGMRKRPREHNDGHLKWIRTLPCLVSGRRFKIEAAHIRYADARFGKAESGIGAKPDDRWTVPLNAEIHRTGPEAQHNANERAWWAAKDIDPVVIALALHGASGDDAMAEVIIGEARKRAAT